MSLLTSLVIAGAVAFCAENPAESLCHAREPVVVSLNDADKEYLRSIASEARIQLLRDQVVGGPITEQNRGDEWRIGSPDDRSNDCEDRVLWIAHKLRSERPDLYAAFLPLLVILEKGKGHLVSIIETDNGPYMIDPLRRTHSLGSYRGKDMYVPVDGIGGEWALRP